MSHVAENDLQRFVPRPRPPIRLKSPFTNYQILCTSPRIQSEKSKKLIRESEKKSSTQQRPMTNYQNPKTERMKTKKFVQGNKKPMYDCEETSDDENLTDEDISSDNENDPEFLNLDPPINDSTNTNSLNHSKKCEQKHTTPKKIKSVWYGLYFVIGMVAVISAGVYTQTINADEKIIPEILNTLDKSLESMQVRFNKQKINFWNEISSGIRKVILHPKKPSIFILFGNESDTINCLAKSVGSISSAALGNQDYLLLTTTNIGNDTGEIISNLAQQIPKKRVVVVQDLLSMNDNAIKVFHVLCDQENPLIEKSAYIITIIVNGYKELQNELEFIEEYIIHKLSKTIDIDILQPLVTRITSGSVMHIQGEQDLSKCPL